MFSATLLVSLLAASASHSLAAPSPAPIQSGQSISMPLSKRLSQHPSQRTTTWLARQKAKLQSKYDPTLRVAKRSSGFNNLVNLNADTTYYGSLAIGTPPTAFNVILDSGSSDLWIAGPNCQTCLEVPIFNTDASSSAKNLSTPFSIKYGSGAASGSLFSDNVQMAGFQVPNQVFAVVDTVSANLLDDPISGLLGLAWDTIASSGATPFAQALAQQKTTLDLPLFSFFLTRFLDLLTTEDSAKQFGGQFTLGSTNTSLYTGAVDFVDIPTGREAFWTLPITTLTVQGTTVSIPDGEQFAAIDTGTTLVGGPTDQIAAIYAQIPGAVEGTGETAGYWLYPCATDVKVSFSFGSKTWSISPTDFEIMRVDQTRCVGAFFPIDLGGGSANPNWIIGDTFLKNVYSVFRFDPPSVGFAPLSTAANTLSRVGLPIPTQTIVANPVGASEGASSRIRNAAGASATVPSLLIVAVVGLAALLL